MRIQVTINTYDNSRRRGDKCDISNRGNNLIQLLINNETGLSIMNFDLTELKKAIKIIEAGDQ